MPRRKVPPGESWYHSPLGKASRERREEKRRSLIGVKLVTEGIKVCLKCETEKPVDEFSYQYGKPIAACKPCKAAYVKRHTETNPGYRKKRNTRAMKWYDDHKHEPAFKARARERGAVHDVRRRQRKYRAVELGGGLSNAQWRDILDSYLWTCVYCGADQCEMTQDHIIPLASQGTHDPINVVPACRPCNISKNDTPLLVWLAQCP